MLLVFPRNRIKIKKIKANEAKKLNDDSNMVKENITGKINERRAYNDANR